MSCDNCNETSNLTTYRNMYQLVDESGLKMYIGDIVVCDNCKHTVEENENIIQKPVTLS